MPRLSDEEIRTRLAALSGWERQADQIRRVYSFTSFREAIAFVNRVAELAEAMDHHPDILVEYRRVTLTLSSHDAGGLTERDFTLAGQIQA
jgi:4a-hydroxytetrahydrobiopterin dehydratase